MVARTIELLLSLIFDPANVLDRQSVPAVYPAEDLGTEMGSIVAADQTTKVARYLTVELVEEIAIGLLEIALDAALEAEPFELGRDDLVRAHDGLGRRLPAGR